MKRKLSSDNSSCLDDMIPSIASIKKSAVNSRQSQMKENENSLQKLKRNSILQRKSNATAEKIKENILKTKDNDIFHDIVRNGYSQSVKFDNSMVSAKTNKSKKHSKVSSKNLNYNSNFKIEKKKPQNWALEKEQRHCSVEKSEVDRIFNVLQHNLSPQGKRLGVQQMTPSYDPKRQHVRQLLQKHLLLKDQELQQSKNTLNLDNDTISQKFKDNHPDACQGISSVMMNFEEAESRISNFNSGSVENNVYNISRQETFQMLSNDTFTTNKAQAKIINDEISETFENISRISRSSSSERLEKLSKPYEEKGNERKYIKGHSEQDLKKIKTMFAMMQLYTMVKSDNPLDFSPMLKIWSLLRKP